MSATRARAQPLIRSDCRHRCPSSPRFRLRLQPRVRPRWQGLLFDRTECYRMPRIRMAKPQRARPKAAMSVALAMLDSDQTPHQKACGHAARAANRASSALTRFRQSSAGGTFCDQACPLLPFSWRVRSQSQFGLSGHRSPGRKPATRHTTPRSAGADPDASFPGRTNAGCR